MLTYSTEARFALVISAWAANKGAIRQKPIWGVAIVEVIMLCLIALPTVGVVNVGIEGPVAIREVFYRTAFPPSTGLCVLLESLVSS